MIKVKNWSKYQSYKDRKPPWIRFHRSILDDYKFQVMSAESRALLPMLWLLACENEDPSSGLISQSLDEISFRLRQDKKKLRETIADIQLSGFIECIETVTNTLKKCNETVTTETETETETEKRLAQNEILTRRFDLFWKTYPKKRDKKKAWTAFKRINPGDELFANIQESLNRFIKSKDWIKDDGQFIPYPSTWLNGEQWTDELETSVGGINPQSPEAKKLAEINQILKQKENAPAALLDKYAVGQNYDNYPAMFADLSRIKSQILART